MGFLFLFWYERGVQCNVNESSFDMRSTILFFLKSAPFFFTFLLLPNVFGMEEGTL